MSRLLSVQFLGIFYVESSRASATAGFTKASNLTAYLKKSQSSAAASISACQAFLPWPTMVAAMISYRYFPDMRSAAFKNTAARSANDKLSQAGLAARAESIA